MTKPTMTTTRVRLRFAKRGDLRLVSHHDLLRCLERMLRRASIPVASTQGFNPRPKIVFTLALALGIEGRREVMEIDLTEPLAPDEVRAKLAAVSPEGLEWLEAESVGNGRAAQADAALYRIHVPEGHREATEMALSRFLASQSWPYLRRRPGRESQFDLRPFLLSAELTTNGDLDFRMRISPSGSARPEEFIEALDLRGVMERGSVLIRAELELVDVSNHEELGPRTEC